MAKKIFITGTGTDVGKTYISALIVKKMREAGYNCGYFKPVISGVTEMCGHLMDSDANYVIQTANIPTEAEQCVSYYWQEAVSPHLAAKRKNQEIDIDKIKYDFAQINKKYDYLLIEGAGGITCPLKINSEEKYLLINAVDISVDDVYEIANKYSGIALPAHIDKNSNSMVSVLGTVPNSSFTAFEFADFTNVDEYVKKYSSLLDKRFISNSDAHYLWDISEAKFSLKLDDEPYSSQKVRDSLIDYLLGKDKGNHNG